MTFYTWQLHFIVITPSRTHPVLLSYSYVGLFNFLPNSSLHIIVHFRTSIQYCWQKYHLSKCLFPEFALMLEKAECKKSSVSFVKQKYTVFIPKSNFLSKIYCSMLFFLCVIKWCQLNYLAFIFPKTKWKPGKTSTFSHQK